MIKRHTSLSDNTLVISLSAVLLGLIAGAILIVCIGENPFIAFSYLFRGGLMNIERIGNTLATATTLLLVGLSVSFAFKTGLFNIGGSGQMLIGGLLGSMFALSATSMPRPIRQTYCRVIRSMFALSVSQAVHCGASFPAY